MKLSTKSRYGLRALMELALTANEDHQSLSVIAKRQKISPKYLEVEFAMLRQAGIVKSRKGASGGYSLARPAEMIRVDEVLRALEGDLSIVDEPDVASGLPIRRFLHETVYSSVSRALETRLHDLTLADLLRPYRKTQADRYPTPV